MGYTITNGEEFYLVNYCFYCQIDTAGQHEFHCPLYRQNTLRFWYEVKEIYEDSKKSDKLKGRLK